MTAAALAARCLDLLGPSPGAIAVVGPHAAALRPYVAPRDDLVDPPAPAAAIVTFLGAAAGPAARQALLADVRTRLAPGAPLVLVDHNQPRRLWQRLPAVLVLLRAGLRPVRGRYPAARELQALGFDVECLRLADGERVQLVFARRPPAG